MKKNFAYSRAAGKRIEVVEITTGAGPTKTRQWRRTRITTTWAPIPHHRGIELAKRIQAPALAVLLLLEHLIHSAKSNRVKLTNDLFKQYGIARQSKRWGLTQLVDAGVITIEQAGKAAPFVTHLWYTEDGELRGG
jgi:hypothetical protein